jgi:hypothetical protein
LVATGPKGLQGADALGKLAFMELREGRNRDAVAHVEQAGKILDGMRSQLPDPHMVTAVYNDIRGIAFMRLAEEQNCVTHHGPGACIMPIRGSAVHAIPEPGREAMKSWIEVARNRPGDLKARWLANIMAMVIGEYPDGLPEDLRIDFDKNQSTVEHLGEFTDVATAAGLADLNRAGGVTIEDFDGDGLLDWISSTSDPRGALRYRHNDGKGKFEDWTETAGLGDQLGGLNLISADHDGDGDPDLLVLRGGWMAEEGVIRMSLLRNDGGHFTDITREAGMDAAAPTQAAVWADFDGDGDLDLYVADELHELQHPEAGAFPARLYRNEGNGTYVDIAAEAGVTNDLQGKGVSAGDYDNDGDMDLYVSNVGPNRLYRNDGGMKFTDVAVPAGVIEPVGRSFVPFFFDYDDDGWLDLWVGAYDTQPSDLAADLLGLPRTSHSPRLYHNEHDGTFTDHAAEYGLDHPYAPMGCNFGDIDYDGWLDIYLGTGDPEYTSLMPNVMLWNDHGKRFLDVTKQTRLGHLQKGHGVSFVDIDGDGDQDIAHELGGFYRGDPFHNAMFLNPGPAGHFVWITFVGSGANRQAIGARIEVEVDTPAGRRVLHRAQGSVSSFGGSPLGRMEIGLGDAKAIREVRVRWPDGTKEVHRGLALDSHVEIREGEKDARPIEIRHVPIGSP